MITQCAASTVSTSPGKSRYSTRDLPERQQTLRHAIAWSYDLLEPDDQALFAGMSVFVGGLSLEAAEQVLSAETPRGVLDGLASLVDDSLVRRVDGGAEPRFIMLETIRAFAEEGLAESDRLDDLRGRHADYFAALVERARPEVLGSESGHWLDRLELDHDNLRAVLAWATERSDAALALRVSAGLWRFWQRRGYLAEGLSRVRAALEMPGLVDRGLRAEGYEAAGGLAYWPGGRHHHPSDV